MMCGILLIVSKLIEERGKLLALKHVTLDTDSGDEDEHYEDVKTEEVNFL